MKVFISLVQLRPGVSGGIGLYAKNIAYYLAMEFPDVEIHLIETFFNHKYFCDMPPGRCTRHLLRQPYRYQDEMQELIDAVKPDIVFSPVAGSDPLPGTNTPKFVVCIADLQHITYPEYFSESDIKARNNAYSSAISSSHHVVTISQHAKSDICRVYNLQENDVSVVSPALDKSYFSGFKAIPINDLMEKFDIPEEYVYYPANFWMHKNHVNLFKAIKILDDEEVNIDLVLTGDLYNERPDLKDLIDNLGIQNKINILGYITQTEVHSLFQQAKLIVFPSLFEGFGIPVLEAYSNCVPLCCSNITSLPEVAGNGALLFNPEEPAEIAAAIKKLYFDDKLSRQLIVAGKEQLEKYDYKNSVRVLHDLFASLLNHNKSLLEENDTKIKPLVTVVTPSYNQGEFIEETIKSVLCQSYENIEYIVMDGGSSDNSVEILEKYSDVINWTSEADKGQTDAINKGLKISKGEYFCYLNSDDTLETDAIKNMLEYLQAHPETSVVYGNADYIDKNSNVTSAYETYDWDFERFKGHCFICQPAAMWRRKTMDEFGTFDDSLQLIMDYEYWLRIAHNGGILSHLPIKIANSRLYEETKTMSCRESVFNEIFSVTKEMFGETSYQWKKAYALYLVSEKYNYLNLNSGTNTAKSLAGAVLTILYPADTYRVFINKLKHEKYRIRNKIATTLRRYRFSRSSGNNQLVSGMYSDGWVSNTLSINYGVERALQMVVLEGEAHRCQTLTIDIDGMIYNQKVDPGDFSVNVSVKSKLARKISITSDTEHDRKSTRKLAYILTYTNLFNDLDVSWKL